MNTTILPLAVIAPRGASEPDLKAAIERCRAEVVVAAETRNRAAAQKEREEAEARERAIFRFD